MAETNLIKSEDLVRVREVEFVSMFADSVKKLREMLGITRMIPKQAGTTLKSYKAQGTLESGVVAEGETIPLSHYETVPATYADITLKKWRKATTAEAIIEKGFEQAVEMTTDRMLKDVQKGIRGDFLNFLATVDGRTTASGAGLQAAIAETWGKAQVLFEDDEVSLVHFVHPQDIADYLKTATITVQNAFGMRYVEDFLGMGTVIMTALVTKGKIYTTAADNIVLYYVPVNGADLNEAFEFTSDETGLIGIHEVPDYSNMTCSDTVINGMVLFADRADGIIETTITAAESNDLTDENGDAITDENGDEITDGNGGENGDGNGGENNDPVSG